MFRMFRRSNKRPARTPLALGTGDRDEVRTTMSSNALAHEMLKAAQAAAQDCKSGEEVAIELISNHRDVHHLELMLSIMSLAPRYGLRAGVQSNNHQSFTKL